MASKYSFIIKVDEEKCKGCGLCIGFCPQGVLVISPRRNSKGYHPVEARFQEKCTGCLHCITICPDVAITIYRKISLDREKVKV